MLAWGERKKSDHKMGLLPPCILIANQRQYFEPHTPPPSHAVICCSNMSSLHCLSLNMHLVNRYLNNMSTTCDLISDSAYMHEAHKPEFGPSCPTAVAEHKATTMPNWEDIAKRRCRSGFLVLTKYRIHRFFRHLTLKEKVPIVR